MGNTTELADGVGKILKQVPELYDDGLKDTVKESGKIIALIPRAIKAALAPVQIWIMKREYNVAETEKLLSLKLENVDPEKIVPPEPYVAIPAIQAISYSMDSEELRNMYANLLAKAMVTDTKDSVHPSFVEIIKQMSPDDAQILKAISSMNACPLITLSIQEKMFHGANPVSKHIAQICLSSIEKTCKSLENLTRCGLIELNYLSYYGDDSIYQAVRNTNHFISLTKMISKNKNTRIVEKHGRIILTVFGKDFYNTCVKDD